MTEISNSIEGIFIELNLRKKKWLLCRPYNPHKSFISRYFCRRRKHLDTPLTKYDNFFLMGDFNVDKIDGSLIDFLSLYNLKHLIKVSTCYKSPDSPCIDLMLTNCHGSFQNLCAVETGLSDFSKMTVTALKKL